MLSGTKKAFHCGAKGFWLKWIDFYRFIISFWFSIPFWVVI
jgi:hypothetical protein